MRSKKTKKVNNAVKSLKQINWKSTSGFSSFNYRLLTKLCQFSAPIIQSILLHRIDINL